MSAERGLTVHRHSIIPSCFHVTDRVWCDNRGVDAHTDERKHTKSHLCLMNTYTQLGYCVLIYLSHSFTVIF